VSEAVPESAVPVRDTLDSREAGGKIIRGGSLRAATYVAGVLVGAASVPFVVRHLGVVDYGHFVTVLSLIFIVAGVTEGGLGNLGVREYATRDAVGRAALLRNLLGLRLMLGAIGVSAAVAFAAIADYGATLVAGTAIAGLGVLALNAQLTLSIPLQTELRLGWLSALDAVRQLATTALMVLLVIVGAELLPFYAVAPAASLAILAATVVLVRHTVPLLPGFDLAAWWALLRETVYYAAATALGIVYFQVAIIATSLLSTEAETGYYSVGFRIVDIVNGIPWLLAVSAFPLLARAARDDDERLRYALGRMLETALIVGMWFAIVTFASAPFAIEVVGGEEFDESVSVLRLLAIGMPATFVVATLGFALLSTRLHRQLIVANGIALGLAILLSLLLIPSHGADGSAITTASLELVLATSYGVLLVRARPDLLAWPKRLPRAGFAAALALAAALLLQEHSIVAAAAATAVYLGALLVMRAVPEEIGQALRDRPRPKRAG
jgi:O-antigen/teichoic acid export membrane protein